MEMALIGIEFDVCNIVHWTSNTKFDVKFKLYF